MRPLNEIIGDANLTEEEFRELRKAVVKPRYVDMAGRRVIPVRKVSIGRQEYGFDTQTDLGDADIIKKATNFPGLDTDQARTLIPILKHGIAFHVSREDLLSSRQYGESLETKNAVAAANKTNIKENNTIIQGSAKWGVNGLYTGAGKTVAGSDWGTNDPTDDIRAAMGQLDAGFRANRLLLHNDQFLELYRRTTGTDTAYKEIIEKYGIEILVDRDIAAGTGLLMQRGSEIAELIVAEELDLEKAYKLEGQTYVFNTFQRSVPAIYQANAICKFTGI